MEAPLGQNVLSTHTGLNLFSQRHMAFIYHILCCDKLFSPNLDVHHNKNGKDEVKKKCHNKEKKKKTGSGVRLDRI